jgi:hypothetical protein
VVVRVATAAATAAAAGPLVGSMVGASAVAAAAVRVSAAAAGWSTVRDDLAVAVATLWRSASVGASTVGLGWELSSSTVRTVVGVATCSFVVAVPGGRKLGDDLPGANSLGLACDCCDRHEALLSGSVNSALDRLKSFRKVADGEIVAEASATFAALLVTLTSSVSVCGGLVCWSISRELVRGDVFKVLVLSRP